MAEKEEVGQQDSNEGARSSRKDERQIRLRKDNEYMTRVIKRVKIKPKKKRESTHTFQSTALITLRFTLAHITSNGLPLHHAYRAVNHMFRSCR